MFPTPVPYNKFSVKKEIDLLILCDAGKEWRTSFGPIISKVKKYYIEICRKEHPTVNKM